ncbi:hypothetical protein MRQ36_07275 [Micromonospora sp. R77]|uniref:hypothetical protein n=1 Tax=Micromonospora sp. R77 TaxID=2925836 RepID=UPI001F611765|nr:hypothetical protein [Micromonospora sp. R77]MCI4062373.1 hypothetical protein [Micromonospora sp. R77]
MTDLDQQILRTLRERAERPVDIDRLTARAVAGGRPGGTGGSPWPAAASRWWRCSGPA